MKTFLMGVGAVVVALAMTACNPASKEAQEAENAAATLAQEESAGVAGPVVVDLEDDSVYRPGQGLDILTILDFNATWCGPCKQLAPVFHQMAEKYKGKINFVSVDVDRNPETAGAYGVKAVPTVVFIRPDGSSSTYEGTSDLLPVDKLEALITEALN